MSSHAEALTPQVGDVTVTLDELRGAQAYVERHAKDEDDATDLLDALGVPVSIARLTERLREEAEAAQEDERRRAGRRYRAGTLSPRES